MDFQKRQCPYRRILGLALPNIISNITVPLLSLVDVGLAGHLQEESAIGAIAVATTITNTVYWLFGFLRLGTTGFVAQSYGRSNVREICQNLGRGVVLASCSSLLILLLWPLLIVFANLMSGGQDVLANHVVQYLNIALLGAPAAMGIYLLNGFLVGMQDTRSPMFAAIATNVINISISWFLVRFFGWGIQGIAYGTIIAQYGNFLILLYLIIRNHRRTICFFQPHHCTIKTGYAYYLKVGRNLFLRSAMLSSVTLFFTYGSSSLGTTQIAANTLLMQMFYLFSYFMDGFAYAGEALSGKYIGMKRKDLLDSLIKRLFIIGTVLSIVGSSLYLLFPSSLFNLLSNQSVVIDRALDYKYWMALIPITGFAAFLWDGIYVGSTQAYRLMQSMLIATASFFLLYFIFSPIWPSHALWLAFNNYLLLRGIVQTILWHRYPVQLQPQPQSKGIQKET